MRSSTGRWVIGDDFFNREEELKILESRVRERNHVLLSGQRRMGKTSVLRELGRRMEDDGWTFLFVDVEGATCPEDTISYMAQAAYQYRAFTARFLEGVRRWFGDNVEEISASEFGLKFRAALNTGNWRNHGEKLFGEFANFENPVLLVIDEIPILLKRMLQKDGGATQVDEFMSWLRGAIQGPASPSPVVILSGSIGLGPIVQRLGISDRINYLDPYRLGPWSRKTSIDCLEQLAKSHDLVIESAVADEVYEALGVGIPHHVQSFFARLREHAIIQDRSALSMSDVREVYQHSLLGPSGQNDLMHYEARLKEALDDDGFRIAMEILAEAALEGNFTAEKENILVELYREIFENARAQISDVLDILIHDGYLEKSDDGYFFSSHLLKDWLAARFRSHHVALQKRKRSAKDS